MLVLAALESVLIFLASVELVLLLQAVKHSIVFHANTSLILGDVILQAMAFYLGPRLALLGYSLAPDTPLTPSNVDGLNSTVVDRLQSSDPGTVLTAISTALHFYAAGGFAMPVASVERLCALVFVADYETRPRRWLWVLRAGQSLQ